jgi:uncharacterized lipoprotein
MKSSPSRLHILLLAAMTLLLVSACKSGNKKPGYYNETESPSLDVPSGLDYPDTSQALVIQTPYMQPPAMVMTDIPPRISSTTSGIDKNSRLSWSAQGLYLLVEDTPESVHRRLGLVIDRSGMQRVRVDENGVYRFDYYQVFQDDRGFFRKMAFWSRDKSEDYSGAYQTFTQPDGENTRVYIKYADGSDCEPDAAEHVLIVLGARMG